MPTVPAAAGSLVAGYGIATATRLRPLDGARNLGASPSVLTTSLAGGAAARLVANRH